jgi:hypothetical protein
MNRIVILEGPDGAGKTTFAKHLSQKHDFYIIHTGVPDLNVDLLEEYGYDLWRASQMNQDVVFDRLHVGECIYGLLIRNHDRLGPRGMTLMQRLVTGIGAQVVFCMPPYEVAEANWTCRHTEYVKDRVAYQGIYNGYKDLSSAGLFAGSVNWDYTIVDIELAASTVLLSPPGRIPEDVIGSQRPHFLLVGDTANQERLDLPFFTLDGSSEFLNSCIKDAGYQEHEIALANAYTLMRQRRDLKKVMEFLGYPAIIALGGRAAEAIKQQHLPIYRQLYHPQYWRRFHTKQRQDYINALIEARENRFRTPMVVQ